MKKLDIFFLVYKIVILVLVVAVLAWGLYCVYDYVNVAKTEENNIGSALGVAVALILSIIADAALVVLSLPGLIVSICNKTNLKRKRDIVHFSILTASPAVGFAIFYLVTTLATNMVSNM